MFTKNYEIHDKIRKIMIFDENFEFFIIFQKNQNAISPRVFVQMTSELVRLKALDPYFSKIKKFFILPQSPLISEGVEEASKSQF